MSSSVHYDGVKLVGIPLCSILASEVGRYAA